MTETLKPCPLAEALELTQVHFSSEENAVALRVELAKRGYAITRAPDDVAQIVAWLREYTINLRPNEYVPARVELSYCADAIERGDWKDKDDG